jgi:hypothetical protein
MKRSTRRLHKKNKNKPRQMGGTTREEWDTFTKESFERIKKRQEEKGTNAAKTEELLKFAKDYYELAWKNFQVHVEMQKNIKELSDKFNLVIKDILPEVQVEMDDEITSKLDEMMLNTSEGANYNLMEVNNPALEE